MKIYRRTGWKIVEKVLYFKTDMSIIDSKRKNGMKNCDVKSGDNVMIKREFHLVLNNYEFRPNLHSLYKIWKF